MQDPHDVMPHRGVDQIFRSGRNVSENLMKLLGHRPRASRGRNVVLVVPLDPACKAGFAEHLPVKRMI